MKQLALFAFLSLLVLAAPVLAVTAPPAVNPDDLGSIFSALTQALALSGPAKWFAVLFVGVMGAVWAVRRFVPAGTAAGVFIRSDEGGTLLGWTVSAAGTLLAKVVIGGGMSWAMALAAFVAAAGGSGALWSQARRLLRLLIPLVSKIPGVGGVLAQLLGYLSGAGVKAQIIKETDAAYKAKQGLTPSGAAGELGR